MATNQKRFFIEKSTEKSELLVHGAKVCGQKIEAMDQKIRNFQLTKIGKKGEARMTSMRRAILETQNISRTIS